MSSRRIPLLLALVLALPATGVGLATAQGQDAGDEILLGVAYAWKVKGATVSGAVTNGDRSDVTGTAKVVRTAGGRTTTFATGGRLMVAAGGKQTVKLTLTKAGKSWFKRHRTASGELVLKVTAGTRSGDVSNEIRLRRA